MTYREGLRDPRWFEKRADILARADGRCEDCGVEREEKHLHVHHGYYSGGRMPWEYEDDTLHALCEDCHEEAQVQVTLAHRALAKLSTKTLRKVVPALVLLERALRKGDDEIARHAVEGAIKELAKLVGETER